MSRALLVLTILGSATARADSPHGAPSQIEAPEPPEQPPRMRATSLHAAGIAGVLSDRAAIEAALAAPKVTSLLDRCASMTTARLLGWIVVDRGKATSVDVGGTSTPKLAACVKRALREVRLESKQRTVVVVELASRPADPLDALLKLAPGQIKKTIMQHTPAIRACQAKDAKTAGKVMVRFQILANGSVGEATVKSDTVPPLSPCVIATLKKIQFPRSDSETWVSYPFVFGP